MTDTVRYTITYRRRIVWWKRPWYWVRREPTTFERTYPNVRITNTEIYWDGDTVVLHSDFVVEPDAQQIHISRRLTT